MSSSLQTLIRWSLGILVVIAFLIPYTITVKQMVHNTVAYAAPACGADDPFCLDTTAEVGQVKPGGEKTPELSVALGRIVKALLGFVGVIFFVLTVYAGVRWMLARGNQEEVDKAKGTIEHAVIGLIVTIASYTIVTFIVNTVIENTNKPAPPAPPTACTASCYTAASCPTGTAPAPGVCSTGAVCCTP